jgi:hypothetical protein
MAEEKVDFKISATDHASAAFKSAQHSLESFHGSYEKLAAVLAGAGLVLGFAESLRGIIETGDELNKASEKYGVAVESLSSLRFAAKLANVEFGDLETGLKKLSVNAAAAAGGAKEQSAAFEAMGVKVANSSGQLKATDTLLREIGEKFSSYEDGPAKAALAVELFGKSGASLIPLLNKLKESEEEAKNLGAIFSKDLAKSAEDFNDNITRMNAVLQANKLVIANDVLPWLNKMLEQMIAGRKIAGGFTDALRLFGLSNINSDNAGQKIQELQAERQKIADLIAAGAGPSKRANELTIQQIDKQLEFAKFMQRQAASALEGGDTPGERARMGLNRTQAPIVPKSAPSTAAAEKDTTFEQLKRQYDELLAKAGDLTMFEQTLNLLATDRYKKLLPNQKDEILNLAAQVDLKKEDERVQREAEQAAKSAASEELRRATAEAERLNALQLKWLDAIDVTAKYKRELVDIEELEQLGYLTADQAVSARTHVWDEQLKAQQRLVDKTEEQIDLWKDFGIAASHSLEDVLLRTHKVTDAANALATALASAYIRQSVINPLANSLPGFLKGLFPGSGNTIFPAAGASDSNITSVLATDFFGPFAGGGDFTVGGAGGTDSRLVSFRATPGERVSVRTPGQSDGGGASIDARTYIDARGANRDAVPLLVSALADHRAAIERLQSADAYRRGGPARRLMRG